MAQVARALHCVQLTVCFFQGERFTQATKSPTRHTNTTSVAKRRVHGGAVLSRVFVFACSEHARVAVIF